MKLKPEIESTRQMPEHTENAIETTVAERIRKTCREKADKEPQPKTIPRTKHSHAIRTPLQAKTNVQSRLLVIYFFFLALLSFRFTLAEYLTGPQKTSPPSPTLLSIKVAPNPSIDLIVGDTEQFTATGTYSDGSTNDISSQVTWIADWTSGNNIVANISSIGLAIGLTPGRTDYNGVRERNNQPSCDLIVKAAMPVTTTPTLTSINIDYSGAFYPNLTVWYAQYFKATGNYSDGSVANITYRCLA